MEDSDIKTAEALETIIRLLTPLDVEARKRIFTAVLAFFQINVGASNFVSHERPTVSDRSARPSFSERETPSPKEFLLQKQPRTDVERIACLAYYLTHFRDTPFFKTLDLAKLNTEAAQPKFSNAAYSATNAASAGYLAPGPSGQRQISAAGEQFVIALPDRVAARAAITSARRRKNTRRKKGKNDRNQE